MKKSLVGAFGGMTLAVLLLCVTLGIAGCGESGNGQVSSQPDNTKPGNSQTESVVDTEDDSHMGKDTEIYTEPPTEVDKPTEIPTEVPTEPETPTENPENSEDKPEPKPEPEPEKPVELPYYIMINRAENCITIFTKDADGNYTVPYKNMICSVGLDDGTDDNATPLGTFKISDKYVWRKLFGSVDVWGHYSVRIVGHILFHSVPYTNTGIPNKSDKTLWEGQYNKLGQPASLGCIRLAVKDSKWIYDNCPPGTLVTVYDEPGVPGPLGRPEAIKIPDNSPLKAWDPTDPDPLNPWNKGNVEIDASTVRDLTVERGGDLDIVTHIKATDIDTLPLEVQVITELDINKAGTYKVTYVATGVTGAMATAEATITVVDTILPTIVVNKDTAKVDDSYTKEQILETIAGLLTATDKNVKEVEAILGAEALVVDTKALDAAMKDKLVGDYECKVYAVDAAGNKSNEVVIKLTYERKDVEKPVISVIEKNPSVIVDLTNVATEKERLEKINAAAALVQGTHFTVSDDLSAVENIKVTISGAYNGSTKAGEYEVVYTLKAKDEAGKSAAVQITVKITVKDETPAEEPSTEEPSTDETEDSELDTNETEDVVSDVLMINNAQTISNQTIETDVYITSTGVVTFENVTVNGNIYCYGQLKASNTKAKNVCAYAYGSMFSCDAYDGTHGKISGSIKCDNLTVTSEALDYAFDKWGKQ